MRFISVCSGIEAASVAAKPLGWQAVAFSEIEPFPCALLAHHYPDTPNWGDMTKFKEWPDVSIDLLCGGTPCQSFSVAGLRKGLDDPRGNLMLTFGAIAAKYRPKWLVWENVPGVLSSNEGRDFGAFLGMLGQLGYGFAYRVLDAQYFGVAQRRRRVFVVGCLGDWRSAAAVLFERHSLQGHPAPSRKTGQRVAPCVTAGAANGGPGHGARSGDSKDELIVPVAWPADVASTLDAHFGDKMGLENQHINAGAPLYVPAMAFAENSRDGDGAILVQMLAHSLTASRSSTQCPNEDTTLLPVPMLAHALRGEGFDASEDGTGRGTPLVPVVAATLEATAGKSRGAGTPVGMLHPVAFDTTQITSAANYSNPKAGDPCHPLAAQAHVPAVAFIGGVDNENNGFNIDGPCGPLMKDSPTGGGRPLPAVAFHENQRAEVTLNDTAGAVKCAGGWPGQGYLDVLTAMQVRRLTPEECEALQGFPRGYTAVPHRGKPAADGPRYKALGNSWAVPNVRWIFHRIDLVSNIKQMSEAA